MQQAHTRSCDTHKLLWYPQAAVIPKCWCFSLMHMLFWLSLHAAASNVYKCSHHPGALSVWNISVFSVLTLVWRRLMKMRVLLVFVVCLVLRGKSVRRQVVYVGLRSSARTSWTNLHNFVCTLPYAEYCNIFFSCTAAAQSTCTDLQRLADSGSGIICSRNPECTELRCNVTQFNIRALVRRATITVLPCNQPAAAQLVLYNSINTVILNETQNRTASHPFGNLLLSVQLMVTVEHPTGSQIRIGVKCLVNVFYTGGNIDLCN